MFSPEKLNDVAFYVTAPAGEIPIFEEKIFLFYGRCFEEMPDPDKEAIKKEFSKAVNNGAQPF